MHTPYRIVGVTSRACMYVIESGKLEGGSYTVSGNKIY